LATSEDFLSLDLRVGTIVSAKQLKGARKPSFVLTVDFGEIGTRETAATIPDLYELDDLVGVQVVAVVNLPPQRVAGLDSAALVLIASNGRGESVLVIPDQPVPDGSKVAG
jgi:tRNA-binding protein